MTDFTKNSEIQLSFYCISVFLSYFIVTLWKWKMAIQETWRIFDFILKVPGIFLTDYEMPLSNSPLELKKLYLSGHFIPRIAHWNYTICLGRPCKALIWTQMLYFAKTLPIANFLTQEGVNSLDLRSYQAISASLNNSRIEIFFLVYRGLFWGGL